MNNVVALFLERLAERLTTLLAGLVSSKVEGLHATLQAEQQSQLEELARKYEAEGKPEIAATLRHRLSRLASPDLASGAMDSMQSLAGEPPRLGTSGSNDLTKLPDFSGSPNRNRKTRLRPDVTEQADESTGGAA